MIGVWRFATRRRTGTAQKDTCQVFSLAFGPVTPVLPVGSLDEALDLPMTQVKTAHHHYG